MSTRTFLNSSSVRLGVVLMALLLVSSCGFLKSNLLGIPGGGSGSSSDGDDETYSPSTPAIEAAETYAIALGGVAPGRDELILTNDNGELLYFGGSSVEFEIDNDVVGLLPRPDYDSFADGSGAQIIPQNVGFAVITYIVDNTTKEEQFLAIVPPQSLIKMMVAEASVQLTDEATVNGSYHVELTSSSPTANALGAVTRNRIELISADLNYALFNVNGVDWLANPDASYYDSVINAEDNGIYQYSVADPDDPSYEIFDEAETRSFLPDSYHRAYDQAVLSASYIYSGDTADPTGGAFAFYSPTADEWSQIQVAYNNAMTALPVGCGIDNDSFPYYDNVQIVIVPDVWTYDDGRPAFVFVRERTSTDYVVVYN